ncbi:hypothetical protein MKZ12_09805 [Paenibacillus sp. FSL R5-0713]|uniref:hypothetical protein n=1 Tax=Paenibacillus sp. FSL R5-0713 TaxID=2921655 RepID=UPI0030D8F2B0
MQGNKKESDKVEYREFKGSGASRVLAIVGVTVIGLIVLLKVLPGDGPDTNEAVTITPAPQVEVINTAAPVNEEATPEPEPVEPAFDWATAEVTEENVRKALLDNVGGAFAIPITDDTFRKFASSSDLKGEYVELTVNPGTFWDEKDFVKRAGGSLIAYSKILFQNPKVYEVSVDVKIDNVVGGENDAVYISWRRDQAEKLDADTILDNMFGDYTIPFQVARKYRLTKEIYDKLEKFELPRQHNL